MSCVKHSGCVIRVLCRVSLIGGEEDVLARWGVHMMYSLVPDLDKIALI